MNRTVLRSVQRTVIKIGTSVLTKDDTLNETFIADVARQITTIRQSCPHVVLVSSGAIGFGKQELSVRGDLQDIRMRQACASVGQPLLMRAYHEAFAQYGCTVSQVLLTRQVFDNRRAYLHLRDSVETLLSLSVLPIMNENDSISTREIEKSFGDNDCLSALIASKLDAQLLLILTDVDNLYTKDPRFHNNALPLSYVSSLSREIRSTAGGAGKSGTGGMRSKLEAVDIASTSGCYTVIAHAHKKDIIQRVLAGEEIGTLFAPGKKLRNRARWILHSIPAGIITIDDGALEAVRNNKNLLIIWVTSVSGNFEAGDVVALNDCAKCISQFNSYELQNIAEKQEGERGTGKRVLARTDDIIFTDT